MGIRFTITSSTWPLYFHIRTVHNWMSVCWRLWFDWSFARFIAAVVTTTSIILSSNKIQKGDIQVSDNPGCRGKWRLNECRRRCRLSWVIISRQSHDRLECITIVSVVEGQQEVFYRDSWTVYEHAQLKRQHADHAYVVANHKIHTTLTCNLPTITGQQVCSYFRRNHKTQQLTDLSNSVNSQHKRTQYRVTVYWNVCWHSFPLNFLIKK